MKVKLAKCGMVKMIDGQSRIDDCLKDGWEYADKPVDVIAMTMEYPQAVEAPKRRGRPPRSEQED